MLVNFVLIFLIFTCFLILNWHPSVTLHWIATIVFGINGTVMPCPTKTTGNPKQRTCKNTIIPHNQSAVN